MIEIEFDAIDGLRPVIDEFSAGIDHDEIARQVSEGTADMRREQEIRRRKSRALSEIRTFGGA